MPRRLPSPHPSSPAPRRGLSLLEVILSIAILGGAIATIGQLLRIGARNAAAARDLAMAQLYCETKVNELLISTTAPETISDVELDETSAKGEWLYKIERLETDTPGVLLITVTVGQNPSVITRPVSHTVSRLMADPQMAQELATQDATLKQAFADAKTAAEGTMSGTVAYSANSGLNAGGGGMAGGGGGGGRGGNAGGGGGGGGPNGGGDRDRGGRGDDRGGKRDTDGPPNNNRNNGPPMNNNRNNGPPMNNNRNNGPPNNK